MKTLFAVAALCAAALCAILFPDMKKLLLLIPFSLALLAGLSACSSPGFVKHFRALPDGQLTNFSIVETATGGINTKIEGEHLTKLDGKITATKIHAQHTNPWIPNIEFKADEWTLDVGPSKRPRVPTFAEQASAAPLSPVAK